MPSRRTTLAGAGGGLALLAAGRGLAANGIGRVTRAQGSLAAVRGSAIVGLAAGDDVFVDDILRTGADSRALIDCADGLQIAIGPGTEMAVRSFVTDEPGGIRVVLGLLQGITRLIGGAGRGRPLDRDRHAHRRGLGPLHRMAGGKHGQGYRRAVDRG